jgi:SAM-dependent MidA family methyltransferase
MTTGHPELVDAIASEIRSAGPIPFVRFMELALYHPQFGYYMRPPESGTERIGWSGDYYTSSDVHSILGQALARQARQLDRLLEYPDPFTVVEMGPGKGLLAKHFLSACQLDSSFFGERLLYVLVERSPAMRELQRQNLAPWLDRAGLVTWVEGLDGLVPQSITGLFFSNELIDAFPVHRIQVTAGGIKEIWVDYRDGQFVEHLKPLATTALALHLDKLNVDWPEGYRTEVNLDALEWMRQVAQRIDRGCVITIDYGHTAQDLYSLDRKNGTFLCYFRQLTNEEPFVRVGEQDMTAHVDFSSLVTVGEDEGLHLAGFTNQISFLVGLGVEQMIAALDPESPGFRAALHLLKPNGMGSTFKVLVQHKGIERPELDGLKYKPFFGAALAARGESVTRQASIVNRVPATSGT